MISLLPSSAARGAHVRRTLPPIAWAMLRVRNEHSRAFRGRYSPEHAVWGVEIVESQYWQHVRSVDVVGPNQSGKTFHVCELPTLYDLLEAREPVFYMNGSEDNAKNLWRVRWLPTIRADEHLAKQLLERMEGGEWFERHFADGGLLYSTGPQSASALSQRESRVVRCSELEKTPGDLGNEASAYSLARARAGAYPATHMITSDCTITVHSGLSWKRFLQGDRSRFFIPCPGCGHYACPAESRHLGEAALDLTESNTHLFFIPEIAVATPSAAFDAVQLLCRKCGHAFNNTSFRAAVRAGVWVPVGCSIKRIDDPALSPIPRVGWLDALNHWSALSLADWQIERGQKDPSVPPEHKGPRLPDGILLDWDSSLAAEGSAAGATDEPVLPAFRQDPRKNPSRSFWIWRVFSPKNSLGDVAKEIIGGDIGALTGDQIDDHKMMLQTCLVIPYVEPKIGSNDDLNEDAVLACVSDLPRGSAPENTAGITRAIDIGDNEIHWGIRAFTTDYKSYLVNHGFVQTGLKRDEHGVPVRQEVTEYSRRMAIYKALDQIFAMYPDGVLCPGTGEYHPIRMTYIDSSYLSEDIYTYCAGHNFNRVRPVKGRGGAARIGRRSPVVLAGLWNDSCEKKALACRNAAGGILKHQYFDPNDPRRLMFLNVDYWKREVHSGISATARHALNISRPGQTVIDPWWYVHADLAPTTIIPGTHLQRRDRYITQVIAERWEEWEDPKTHLMQKGWREYQHANHLLDVEAYALAAAGALGLLPRYTGPSALPSLAVDGARSPGATKTQSVPTSRPLTREAAMRNQPNPVRRSY